MWRRAGNPIISGPVSSLLVHVHDKRVSAGVVTEVAAVATGEDLHAGVLYRWITLNLSLELKQLNVSICRF